MVYDASEGSGDPQAPGGAAYVVNEWIDGVPLAERLAEGPLPEREIRTVLRRLADGVAEAHRVGLAVGGLTPDNVVLRPNGLVGLRGVPAASGSIDGDVAALGALLEVCLTGLRPGEAEPRPLRGPSDLVALARRARSTEPGQALSSVAAMAAILADRPRTRPGAGVRSEQPWGDRQRPAEEQRPDPVGPSAPGTVPPVRPPGAGDTVVAAAVHGDTVDARSVPPVAGAYAGTRSDDRALPAGRGPLHRSAHRLRVRRRGRRRGPRPAPPARRRPAPARPAGRHRARLVGRHEPAVGRGLGRRGLDALDQRAHRRRLRERRRRSGRPRRHGAGRGGLRPRGRRRAGERRRRPADLRRRPGHHLVHRDLPGLGGLRQPQVRHGHRLRPGLLAAARRRHRHHPRPGATVEIRTADTRADDLDGYEQVASGTLQESSDLRFDEPVQARYVLLWITGLVESGDGFTGEIGEVTVQAAG